MRPKLDLSEILLTAFISTLFAPAFALFVDWIRNRVKSPVFVLSKIRIAEKWHKKRENQLNFFRLRSFVQNVGDRAGVLWCTSLVQRIISNDQNVDSLQVIMRSELVINGYIEKGFAFYFESELEKYYHAELRIQGE